MHSVIILLPLWIVSQTYIVQSFYNTDSVHLKKRHLYKREALPKEPRATSTHARNPSGSPPVISNAKRQPAATTASGKPNSNFPSKPQEQPKPKPVNSAAPPKSQVKPGKTPVTPPKPPAKPIPNPVSAQRLQPQKREQIIAQETLGASQTGGRTILVHRPKITISSTDSKLRLKMTDSFKKRHLNPNFAQKRDVRGASTVIEAGQDIKFVKIATNPVNGDIRLKSTEMVRVTDWVIPSGSTATSPVTPPAKSASTGTATISCVGGSCGGIGGIPMGRPLTIGPSSDSTTTVFSQPGTSQTQTVPIARHVRPSISGQTGGSSSLGRTASSSSVQGGASISGQGGSSSSGQAGPSQRGSSPAEEEEVQASSSSPGQIARVPQQTSRFIEVTAKPIRNDKGEITGYEINHYGSEFPNYPHQSPSPSPSPRPPPSKRSLSSWKIAVARFYNIIQLLKFEMVSLRSH